MLFFSAHAELPREGWVVDIGLNGVAIVTSAPPPLGTQVDLEIQPKPEQPTSGAIFVRGDVVRVSRASARDYLMAVHLRVAAPDAANYQPSTIHIGDLIAATRRDLQEHDLDAQLVAIVEYNRQEAEEVTHSEASRKRRRVLVLPLFALALGTAWWFLTGRGSESRGDNSAAVQAPVHEIDRGAFVTPSIQVSTLVERAVPSIADATIRDLSGEDRSSLSSQPLDQVTPPAVSLGLHRDDFFAPLSDGDALIDAGDWAGAQAAYEAIVASETAPAVDRARGYLGLAYAYWNQGQLEEARATLRRAGALEEPLPTAWRDAVTSLSSTMAVDAASISEHVPRNVAELARALGEPPLEGARLVIDKSEFVLSVVADGREVRRFPVGLGFAGSTPEGEFVIANMLVDPTWFNRGEAVPPGDDRNPLGSRWLGLGRGGTATSYGIHGTAEPESVGREMSRGCIRMRPRDAEALFALCSVGTHVTIVP